MCAVAAESPGTDKDADLVPVATGICGTALRIAYLSTSTSIIDAIYVV
jgi:hypothetical protein